MDGLSKKRKGMYFAAVREGLSEEAREQKDIEELGMKRAKEKGVRATGLACKVQHTTKGGSGEGAGCPEAHASWAQLPPVSPARPLPCPFSLRALLSRQLQTNRSDLGPGDQ